MNENVNLTITLKSNEGFEFVVFIFTKRIEGRPENLLLNGMKIIKPKESAQKFLGKTQIKKTRMIIQIKPEIQRV